MAREIRHDIDGLKAIAIIAIVLYHFFDLLNLSHVTDVSLFNGGFLGVDVFFVVSGFLITSGIAYKLNTDSFELKDFYKRRFLRILPPLFPVCLFSLVAGYFFIFPEVYLELSKEVLNTLIFTGNFRFANSGGYFSMDSSDKVLLHTWYLCITIQFYLIYPVILKLISSFLGTAKVPFVLALLTLILMITSVYVSEKGNGYLLTQCRIWELFFGGQVFFASEFVKTNILDRIKGLSLIGEIAGLAVIIASIFMISLTNGNWYFTTSIYTVIGTSVVLLSHNLRTVLKNPLFSVIGKTSYSLYLWHWPILVIAVKWGFNVEVQSLVIFLTILCSLVFVSYKYFEKVQYSLKFILCFYIAIATACFYIKYAKGENYLSDALYTPDNSALLASSKPLQAFLTEGNDTVYIMGDVSDGKVPHTFIIGDSHLGHFKDFLRNTCKNPFYYYNRPATVAYGPVFSNMETVFFYGKKERQIYFSLYKQMLSKLKDGDNVIISNRYDVQMLPYLQDLGAALTDDTVKMFANDLVSDLNSQISQYPNLKFYITGQGIVVQKDVVNCAKLDLKKLFYSEFIDKEKCDRTTDANEKFRNIIDNALIEYANSHDNVEFIDRNAPLYDSESWYRVRVSDKPVFEDDNHLTYFGSSVIGSELFVKIIDNK